MVVLWGWNENRFNTLNEVNSFDFIEDNKKLYLKILENENQKQYIVLNIIGRRMTYKEPINSNNSNNSISNCNSNSFINSSMGSQYFNLNRGIIIVESIENETFLIEEISDFCKFPILKSFIKSEDFIATSTLDIISNIEKQLSTLFSLKSDQTADRKYKLILNEFKDSIIQLEKDCKILLKQSNLINSNPSIKYSVIKSVKFLLKEIKFEFYHGDINIKRIELFSQLKKFLKIYFWNSSNGGNNIETTDNNSNDSISSEDSPTDLNLSVSSFPSISSPSTSSYSNINTLTFSSCNNINSNSKPVTPITAAVTTTTTTTTSSTSPITPIIINNSNLNINTSNNNNSHNNYINDDTSSNYTDCTNITNNTNSTTTTTTTTTTTPNGYIGTICNGINGLYGGSGNNSRKNTLNKMIKSPSFKIQLIQEVYIEIQDQCKKIKNCLYELLDNYQRDEYIGNEQPDRDSFSKNISYCIAQEIFILLIKNSNDFIYQIQLLDVSETRKKSKELNEVSNQLFYSTQLLFPSISDHLDFIEMDIFNTSNKNKSIDLKKPILNYKPSKTTTTTTTTTTSTTLNNSNKSNSKQQLYDYEDYEEDDQDCISDDSCGGIVDDDDDEEKDLVMIINKVLTKLEIFSKEYSKIIGIENGNNSGNSNNSTPSTSHVNLGMNNGETISPKCGLFLSHSLSTDSPMAYIKRTIPNSNGNGSSNLTTPVSSLSFNQPPTTPSPHQQVIKKSNLIHNMSPSTMMIFNATSGNGNTNNGVNKIIVSGNSAESTPTFQLNLSTTMDILNSLMVKDVNGNIIEQPATTATGSGVNCNLTNSLIIPTINSNLLPLRIPSHVGGGGNLNINRSIGKSFSTGNFSPTSIMMNRTNTTNAFSPSFEENQLQYAIDNFLEVYTHLDKTTMDTSIWLEEEKEDVNVYYINSTNVEDKFYKSIKYASLNQLVLKLTCESNTELRFTKTFITTYRSFTSGDVFLMKLVQRYFTPNLKNVVPYTFIQKVQIPIQLRVLNVLRLWIEQYPNDFNKELFRMLTMFLNSTRRNGHGQYSDLILKKFKQTKLKERLVTPSTLPPKPKIFWMKYTTEYIFSQSSTDIAEQLTLLDFDSYKSIEEIELLNQAWSKPDQKTNTPNIASMVNRFNSFSSFVSWAILRENDIKQRSKMMLKMIKICYALYKLSNFNGLLAGLSGLNASGVYRLVHTKANITKPYQKKFDFLCKFLDTKKSHKAYRDVIHSTCPPLIPYLGIYLTDLTFIEDGNQDEIKGLINFKKREMIFNTILEIQQYQQQGYIIKPKPAVLNFLCELPHMNDKKKFEDDLYEQSMLLEPKNSTKLDIMSKSSKK